MPALPEYNLAVRVAWINLLTRVVRGWVGRVTDPTSVAYRVVRSCLGGMA